MSIHDHKTASTIIAELKMTRTKLPSSSFLLVEGPDDKRFWNRWIDHRTSTAIISGGKKNLVGALRKLDAARFWGAIGIADADLDRVLRRVCPSPNLVWTHTHDLETALVQLGSARGVVQDLGEVERLHAFEDRETTTLEAALLQRALAFGRIRCAQALHDPEHDLSWLRIPRFVDRTFALQQSDLARVAAAQGLSPALDAIGPWFDDHAVRDPWDLVNGHDLVEILTVGLRHAFGALTGSRGPSDVATALRLAADSSELRPSPLFHAILSWEQASAPHVILRAVS